MRIHFIAIGGSIMHALAICLHKAGYTVTGSDDLIFDPARSKLADIGILPEKTGWFPEKITTGIDAIILGMHARGDNPELQKALELKIPVYSFPSFVAEKSKNKKRIVVAGSHGKTTVTTMIMHVLQKNALQFDHLAGASIDGIAENVSLNNDNSLIILEGDEYKSSAIDSKPKFLWYKPHIAVITGIAWDHINVFPTYRDYLNAFDSFLDTILPDGILIYNEEDMEISKMVFSKKRNFKLLGYKTPLFEYVDDKLAVKFNNQLITLDFPGRHNLLNMQAAQLVCRELGVSTGAFLQHISTFKGAGQRLELLYCDHNKLLVYRDFAHAPSKVSAVLNSVKEQYPNHKVRAFYEFHTYSSLSENFLQHYQGTMDAADELILFVDKVAVNLKNKSIPDFNQLASLTKKPCHIITNSAEISKFLPKPKNQKEVWLFMSSGQFGGFDFKKLIEELKNASSI